MTVKEKNVGVGYFILTFMISWGGVLLAAGGWGGFPANAQQIQKLLPFVVLAMVAGPSLAGISSIFLMSGIAGLREFLSRLFAWKRSVRWYAMALLPAPIMVLTVQCALSLLSPHYLPGILSTNDKVTIVLSGLAAGVVAGLFEEIGWTGFSIPLLRLRFGIFTTGLMVGTLWGLWHLAVAYWGSGTPEGTLSPILFLSQLIFYGGVLPAYRILMVCLYEHTKSLFLAILMHGSLTSVTTFILVPDVTDEERIVYNLALSCAVWVLVMGVKIRSISMLKND